jgi:ribosomal protein S27E
MQIPEQPLQITARDILFECPGCGKSMVIDQAAIGWMVECVGCGTNVIVPGRLAPDAGRWTPLMVAAYAGDSRAVKALLDSGADVHQSSAGGLTALKLAERAGHFKVVRLLWKAGAKR